MYTKCMLTRVPQLSVTDYARAQDSQLSLLEGMNINAGIDRSNAARKLDDALGQLRAFELKL